MATELRRETILTLEEMGTKVEYSHHEVAPSQHEIDLRYNEALGDGRLGHDLPAGGEGGGDAPRGLRDVHAEADLRPERQRHARPPVALQGSENAFFDAKDPYHLSAMAKAYMAGLLKHPEGDYGR